jgi:hypothetical protein
LNRNNNSTMMMGVPVVSHHLFIFCQSVVVFLGCGGRNLPTIF